MAAGDNRPAAGALAKLAVACRAALHVDGLAGLYRALAGRQAVAVRPNVDVPAGNLGRRGGATDVEAWRGVSLRRVGFRRGDDAFGGKAAGEQRAEHERE